MSLRKCLLCDEQNALCTVQHGPISLAAQTGQLGKHIRCECVLRSGACCQHLCLPNRALPMDSHNSCAADMDGSELTCIALLSAAPVTLTCSMPQVCLVNSCRRLGLMHCCATAFRHNICCSNHPATDCATSARLAVCIVLDQHQSNRCQQLLHD